MGERTGILKGYSNYIIHEDGRVYNTRWKRFLKITELKVGDYNYKIIRLCSDEGEAKLFYMNDILKQLFDVKLPEIDGVEHKPVKDYEGIYTAYSNGQIYSHVSCKFLKPLSYNGVQYVALVKDHYKRMFKLSGLIVETFTNYCNDDVRIKYKDKDKSNCSLNNLLITLKKGRMKK